MADWNSVKIGDVLEKIDKEELILPVVQRDFVWTTEKIELLFDTVLKGDSFGGIMTIKDSKGNKPIFAFRKFIQNYQKGFFSQSNQPASLARNISYVVDGQQRLSAFYIGITGTYDNKKLYIDLFSEINHQNFNLSFADNESKLKKEIDNFDGTEKVATYWYEIPNLYRIIETCGEDYHSAFEKIIGKVDDFTEEQKTKIRRNVENFTNQIFKSLNIGICEVQLNKTRDEIENRQKVVELFRRLNQGGTKLDGLELMASKLKGFDASNEVFLNEINVYDDIGFGKDEVIKLIFILQDDYRKSLADISKEDSDFIRNHENRIKCSLEGTKLFLIQSELYEFYKTNKPSIIPLYFIAYFLFHLKQSDTDISEYFKNSDTTNENFALIYKWIYLSMLNRVFRRKGAGWTAYSTGIRKILQILQKYKNTKFPTSQLFDVYDNHPLDFSTDIEAEWLGDYDFDFLMYVIYKKPMNFRKNDIDHIHPKAILSRTIISRKKISLTTINDVANYQLLDFSSNRSKNDKELYEWIKSLTNKSIYLKTHLIPDDEELWYSNLYPSFLEERKKLIIEKLKEELSKKI